MMRALRREELVSLHVTDIDFERSLITVRAEVSKSGRMRHVPFSGFTDHLLKDYIARDRRLLVDAFGGDPDGAVFLSESTRCPGRPLHVGAFNDIMPRLQQRLAQPLQDVHLLLHPRIRQPSSHFWNLLRMLYREMHRREAAFWQWSREDWIAVLGASDRHFTQAHGTPRRSLCALAYFLCGFDAFERIGGLADLATFADPAFGPDWHRAYQALRDVAVGMGYKEEWAQTRHIRNT